MGIQASVPRQEGGFMKPLSKSQNRALKLAAKTNGVVDTLFIKGSTGASLVKMGLMYRHSTDGDGFEGTNVSYELTDKGWEYIKKNPHP